MRRPARWARCVLCFCVSVYLGALHVYCVWRVHQFILQVRWPREFVCLATHAADEVRLVSRQRRARLRWRHGCSHFFGEFTAIAKVSRTRDKPIPVGVAPAAGQGFAALAAALIVGKSLHDQPEPHNVPLVRAAVILHIMASRPPADARGPTDRDQCASSFADQMFIGASILWFGWMVSVLGAGHTLHLIGDVGTLTVRVRPQGFNGGSALNASDGIVSFVFPGGPRPARTRVPRAPSPS